ncbi:hypothetical protein B7R21_14195 [Subtercola boreus]|uniref:Uncharacterized protein n=1 Tax=Subtercola boreus TaxID=120213 RepID=A0A3E0VBW4_9MICO|nr:hypothetical protein B7R21_14195 [Subtercola boreus]
MEIDPPGLTSEYGSARASVVSTPTKAVSAPLPDQLSCTSGDAAVEPAGPSPGTGQVTLDVADPDVKAGPAASPAPDPPAAGSGAGSPGAGAVEVGAAVAGAVVRGEGDPLGDGTGEVDAGADARDVVPWGAPRAKPMPIAAATTTMTPSTMSGIFFTL